MVRVALAAAVQGLARLGADGIDRATLGESAEVAVHGGEPHPRPSGAQLGVEVLRAAEVDTPREELLEGALLAGGALLHGRGTGRGCRGASPHMLPFHNRNHFR